MQADCRADPGGEVGHGGAPSCSRRRISPAVAARSGGPVSIRRRCSVVVPGSGRGPATGRVGVVVLREQVPVQVRNLGLPRSRSHLRPEGVLDRAVRHIDEILPAFLVQAAQFRGVLLGDEQTTGRATFAVGPSRATPCGMPLTTSLRGRESRSASLDVDRTSGSRLRLGRSPRRGYRFRTGPVRACSIPPASHRAPPNPAALRRSGSARRRPLRLREQLLG